MIVYPRHVRFFWWVQKLAPWLTAAMERQRLRQFRNRQAPGTAGP